MLDHHIITYKLLMNQMKQSQHRSKAQMLPPDAGPQHCICGKVPEWSDGKAPLICNVLTAPWLSDELGVWSCRKHPGRWVDVASVFGQSIISTQRVPAAGYEHKKEKNHFHLDRSLWLWQVTANLHSTGTGGWGWERPEATSPQPVSGEAVPAF